MVARWNQTEYVYILSLLQCLYEFMTERKSEEALEDGGIRTSRKIVVPTHP